MLSCMGKLLFVDLSASAFSEIRVPDEVYASVLGGTGLAAALLSILVPPGADPLGPDNILAFMSGMLTGTGAAMTGRWSVSCRSPLTGGWGDANCGTFAPAIRRSGYDGIVFRGCADRPVVLVVDQGGPRLESAETVWGMDAIESEVRLGATYAAGGKTAIAVIGQAAERLSLISGISNDGGRYAARAGVGAVMGSKRLKALVLSGNATVGVADREGIRELTRRYASLVTAPVLPGFVSGRFLPLMGRALALKTVFPVDGLLSAAVLRRWGTIYNTTAGIVSGDSPVRNWGGSVRDFGRRRYRRLDPDRIVARETRKYHCHSCPVGCGGICDTKGLGTAGDHSHKPEYETVGAFGALLLNDDLESIFVCNDLCNRSGLDTISAGATIAFAFECFEHGVLAESDTGGFPLRWGDPEAIVRLLRMMIAREGIGDILADGSAKAAERIGRGAERFAVHAGGQEPGMHDSRYDPMMGVAYAADPTPGRHTISGNVYYNVEKLWEQVPWAPACARPYPKSEEYEAGRREALKSAAGMCLKQVLDAAGGCLFAAMAGLDSWPLFRYLNLAAGLAWTPPEYLETGRRIQTIRQLFNAAQGVRPGRAVPGGRMSGMPPLPAGPLAGRSVPLADMVANLWEALGWNRETGLPTDATVEELGIPPLFRALRRAADAAESLPPGNVGGRP